MNRSIDEHTALVYTMALVSAAEGQMTDAELAVISRIVDSLPAFRNYDQARLVQADKDFAELLRKDDGVDVVIGLVRDSLPAPLRETAYCLACDVIAADGKASQEELRLLEMLRNELDMDRLAAAAIERSAQARHRRV